MEQPDLGHMAVSHSQPAMPRYRDDLRAVAVAVALVAGQEERQLLSPPAKQALVVRMLEVAKLALFPLGVWSQQQARAGSSRAVNVDRCVGRLDMSGSSAIMTCFRA